MWARLPDATLPSTLATAKRSTISPISSTQTLLPPASANHLSMPLFVIRILACESSIMKRSRSAGYAGSSGTYAPPALSTPSRPTTISRLRSTQIATRSSGFTPSSSR